MSQVENLNPHQQHSSGTVLIRRKKNVLKAVEDLDAFPKVPETCVETTSYGGTASLVAVILIIWLAGLEVSYYLDTEYKFSFSPDTDMDAKLSINVDLTVAMPCAIVGADIVDTTNQNVVKFGELEEEYVHFELNDEQRSYFNSKAGINSYLREEYHSLNKILWKNNFINMYSEMPKLTRTESFAKGVKDACRFHGKLVINKVAGNFHITAGKTLPLSRGHAHIAAFMSERDYNFSHRIYKFSFGEGSRSIVLPLEGDEKVATTNHMLYTYFIQVVPTIVRTRFKTYKTYQYSVRELAREIDHEKGSHGISGIFFKYDMSGLKVEVTEESESFVQFLIRLCAIVGGVYATVGMLYNHLSYLGCTVGSFRKRKHKNTSNDAIPLIKNSNNRTINSSHHSTHSRTGSGLTLDFQTADIDLIQPQIVPPETNLIDKSSFIPNAISLQNEGDILPDLLSSHSKT